MTEVELSNRDEELRIHAALRPGSRLRGPECDRACPGYRTRERRWRHLADDRKQESFDGFYAALREKGCGRLAEVVVDMWAPLHRIDPGARTRADAKIGFGDFHVGQHLGDAIYFRLGGRDPYLQSLESAHSEA